MGWWESVALVAADNPLPTPAWAADVSAWVQVWTWARRTFERLPRGVARCAVLVATAGVVAVAVLSLRSSLPSGSQLRHPDLPWLLPALAAEFLSLVAYALIVRALLSTRGMHARTRELMRATVGGIAMGASLPGGQALSSAYWYKLLRREGAGRGLAAMALAEAMLAGVLSLTGLLVLGVATAGDRGPLASARLPILLAAGGYVVLRLAFGRRVARLGGRLVTRLLSVPSDALAIDRRRLLLVVALAYLNWLLDCLCLFAAMVAMGASVPARFLLLTYALAQIVASIPLLPGGGGTVEISLIVGFAAFGHQSGKVVAGVLLYRLISCWGLVPVGWLAILLDRRRGPTGRFRTPPEPDAPARSEVRGEGRAAQAVAVATGTSSPSG